MIAFMRRVLTDPGPVLTPPSPAPVRTADRAPAPPARREVIVYLYWILAVVLIAPVWMGAHFPSEDGLAHLAWTEVYRALGTPGSVWQPAYARAIAWNTPNLAYVGLQYALGAVVDPHIAQQLIISALILAWAGAVYWLSVQVWGRLTVGAFASLLLIHSSWLYGGYLSFLLGVPVLVAALAVVAHIVRINADTPRRDLVALAALGVVAFYAHLVCGALFLVLVALATLWFRPRPRRALGVALAGVPTLSLTLSYLTSGALGAAGMRWEPVSKTVARFVGLAFFRGFAVPTVDFWIALGLLIDLLLVQGIAVVRGRWLRAPSPSGPMSRFILLLAVCLAALYFASPDGVGDAYNLKGRVQLVMWAWLLPSLPATRDRNARRIVIAGVAALLVWQVTTFGARVWRFNTAYASVVRRAEALPAGATLERTLDYEHDAFEGSFIKVLAHAPEDFAYHCRCVLLQGYHPSTAFYWVRTLPLSNVMPSYRIAIRQLPREPVSVDIQSAPVASATKLRDPAPR